MFKKFIGTRQFYQSVIFVAVPIVLQNLITNFVNLLDNIMVGQIGSEAMSGITIVNQLVFVYNLGMWGITAGAGILGTQFYGKQDHKGIASIYRVKIVYTLIYLVFCFSLLFALDDQLLMLYLHESGDGLDMMATFAYAKDYLHTVMWGLPFFMITQIYASTLREQKETRVPMIAGLAAVVINLTFNWLLIYGKLGFPALGVVGAAIATNMSRAAEAGICVIWTHRNREKMPFTKYAFRNFFEASFGMSKPMFRKASVMIFSGFINEFLWSAGQSTINQAMSMRGVAVVSAINITSMVSTLAKSVLISMGAGLAIMVGNALGAGELELAVDTDNKVMALSFVLAIVMSGLVIGVAPFIPRIYNTTPEIMALATKLIRISALFLPTDSLINACYHTIKSGGRTFITFLFDGGFTTFVVMPLALILGHLTEMPIVPMYICIMGASLVKTTVGLILVYKKIWVRNLVSDSAPAIN